MDGYLTPGEQQALRQRRERAVREEWAEPSPGDYAPLARPDDDEAILRVWIAFFDTEIARLHDDTQA